MLFGFFAAIIQLLVGPLVDPGAFGLSRWMSGFVDIVVLPALVPILFYLLFVVLGIVSGNIDFANFALLWLIPGAIIRTFGWSEENNAVHLMLVPVLWTAIAVGIPFFIQIIMNSRIIVIISAALGILVILLAAASSYWAFYSHNMMYGFIFLFVASAPMLVSMVMSFIQADE